MKYLRKFNESKSSIMDGIVDYIMSYAPYIKNQSTYDDLFGLKDSSNWKNSEYTLLKTYCTHTIIRSEIFYHLDREKLQKIYDDNISILESNEKVFSHFNYVISLEKMDTIESITTQISVLSLLSTSFLPDLQNEFIKLIKMYLSLKWTVWNDINFIEDSMVELDDTKIEYKVSLGSEMRYTFWFISIPISSNDISINAKILNILSQMSKRIKKGITSFHVSSNGREYFLRIMNSER